MWTTSDNLIHLAFMAVIIWGAQAFARRAHNGRASREARQLRIALNVGLCALRRLYEDNATYLSSEERPLNCGRNQIGLLRTQLGRLAALEPPEVEAVMAACIAVEGAETEMAIAGRKVGAVAYWIPKKDDAARARVESALREACSALRLAEELLSPIEAPRGESAAPVPRIPEAPADEAPAHPIVAADFGGAVTDIAPYREKARVGELSI